MKPISFLQLYTELSAKREFYNINCRQSQTGSRLWKVESATSKKASTFILFATRCAQIIAVSYYLSIARNLICSTILVFIESDMILIAVKSAFLGAILGGVPGVVMCWSSDGSVGMFCLLTITT